MEIVVLNSDIARLVLDYLKSQKLKRATHTFCKTSPYLKQEFHAYKQGLQTHSFFPELKEIICEYVKISRKVEQILPKLSNALRIQCQQNKLSDKVSEIIDRALEIVLSNQSDLLSPSSKSNIEAALHTSITRPQTSSSINSDKENNNNKVGDKKRKRSNSSIKNQSSNDELTNTDAKSKASTACARSTPSAKKRRILEPYCFLSSKALQRHRRRRNLRRSPCTNTGQDAEIEDDDGDWTNTSTEDIAETEGEEEACEEEYAENDDDVFDGEKPTQESTPRNKSEDGSRAPILPAIVQHI